MKCKHYAISGEDVLARINKYDGLAYLSGYSGFNICYWKNILHICKGIEDFGKTRKYSPVWLRVMAKDQPLMVPQKRSYSIRNKRDKMHVKAVTAARWLYESFVNEEFARSPHKHEALEYVRGMADAGVIMDPFEVMERVRGYLVEAKNINRKPA